MEKFKYYIICMNGVKLPVGVEEFRYMIENRGEDWSCDYSWWCGYRIRRYWSNGEVRGFVVV